MRGALPFLLLGGLVLAGAVLGLLVGPAELVPSQVLAALAGGGVDDATRSIVLGIRLPRVAAAALVGASLGVSGAVFQALLRNPLAEPYLLGVSAGAATGAVAAIVGGIAAVGGAVLPLAALAGGLLAIGVVFSVSSVSGRFDTRVLILAGVVVSAFFGACITLVLTLAPAERLRSAWFWTLGSLSGVSWPMLLVLAAYAIPASLLAWAGARSLDALALGEETAAAVGTEVESVKRAAFLVASLLAAATVSVAGVIGFVGLVVPHAVRLAWGGGHRRLVPLAFLGGAAFLVLTDAAARAVAGPVEVPIGVVTAFLGVPFFLVLLRRKGSA